MTLRIFTFLITLVLASAVSARHLPAEIHALLDTLDMTLAKSDEFKNDKMRRINTLRRTLDRSEAPEARFWIYRELFNEYGPFDSDSALAMADGAWDIANKLGNERWKDEMQLNRSYVYSATGLLQDAQDALDSIDVQSLPKDLWSAYYERFLFLQTHRDQYFVNRSDTLRPYARDTEVMLDSLSLIVKPEDPSYYWFLSWQSMGSPEKARELVGPMTEKIKDSNFDSRDDAIVAWTLSKLHETLGNNMEQVRYLTLSAIADVRSSNREIASLEELAMLLYRLGDLERANTYINYSINCANDYRSRVRVGRLALEQEMVLRAIAEENRLQMHRSKITLGLMLFLLLILLAAIIYIAKQMSSLKQSRLELRDAKSRLEERVAELQQTRTELHNANKNLSELYSQARDSARKLAEAKDASEQHIADVFSLCSNYINKLDDFRKNIYRMIVSRRFDDIINATKTPDLSQGEIKELYAIFDKTFLQIYPNFVDDFNTLLRPEDRICLRKGELTTELRIYALVRLGLNDSVKIAKFLHLSSQTVYNTRQRTRNKAAIPRENFAEAVAALGKKGFLTNDV